jgi:hypothetical protein
VTRTRASKRCDPLLDSFPWGFAPNPQTGSRRFGGAALTIVWRNVRRAALCLVVAVGCGGGAARDVEPAAPSQAAPAHRRPDAVVIEPAAALPSAAATASALGVVLLRAPLDTTRVTDLVESFLGAWERSALDGMEGLLTPDAGPIEARARGKNALLEGWRQRMRAHEYAKLSGVELIRPERIERRTREELAGRGLRKLVEQMLPDDVFVRVPLEVTSVGGDKLFQEYLLLILRPEDRGFRIAAYGESER